MSARSVESCTLLEINRQSFINLLKENEDEYEKFSNIKDGILFHENLDSVNCYVCKKSGH